MLPDGAFCIVMAMLLNNRRAIDRARPRVEGKRLGGSSSARAVK